MSRSEGRLLRDYRKISAQITQEQYCVTYVRAKIERTICPDEKAAFEKQKAIIEAGVEELEQRRKAVFDKLSVGNQVLIMMRKLERSK